MLSENIIRIMEYVRSLDGIDPQVLQEGLEIARLHRQMEQVIENDMAGWGLTARQVEIMEYLYHGEEATMTPAELSDIVGLTRSAMTSALDSLENLGYTVRAPHPSDRRMIAITLTPAGRVFIAKRLPERYKKLYHVMDSLSKNERTVLIRVYRKVIELLVSGMKDERIAGRKQS